MIYCLDTNVLIEPWNKYYSPDLCPDYWNILCDLVRQKRVFCTDEVKREVEKVDDGLCGWIKANPELVHEITEDVQSKLRRVLRKFPTLVNPTKDRSMADPWVVAHAWSADATVVTKEMPSNSLKRIKIPDVCREFNIRCIDDFTFLKEVGIRLSAQRNGRDS